MTIEILIVVFLALLGIILLLTEIFFLPGITIAGIVGALSIVGGISYAFIYIGNSAGLITILSSVVVFGGSFAFLIKSNTMSRIALKTDIESTVDQQELKHMKIGDEGVTISRLNPIGKAEFNNITVEAKSVTGEYIDEGETVIIVSIESYNVLVKLVEK